MYVLVNVMCFGDSFNKLRHITSYHGEGPQKEWTPGMQNHLVLSHVVGPTLVSTKAHAALTG